METGWILTIFITVMVTTTLGSAFWYIQQDRD